MQTKFKKVKKQSKLYGNKHRIRKKINACVSNKFAAFLFMFLIASAIAVAGYFVTMGIDRFSKRERVKKINMEEIAARKIKAKTNVISTNESKKVVSSAINLNSFEKIEAIEFSSRNIKSKADVLKMINQAKKYGKNAIMLSVKDETGCLAYESKLNLAKEWQTVGNEEMLIYDVFDVVKLIKDEGFIPIAKISAFKDDLAPAVSRNNSFSIPKDGKNELAEFKDLEQENSEPSKFLNPCSAIAREYVLNVVKEVKQIGFEIAVLNDVNFPLVEVNCNRQQILKQFINELNAVKMPYIVSYELNDIIDSDRAELMFGGDFSSFGIVNQAPVIRKDSEVAIVSKFAESNSKEITVIPEIKSSNNRRIIDQLKKHEINKSISSIKWKIVF